MSDEYFIVGGTVVSHGERLPESTVHVRGGLIVDVSHAAAPESARRVDASGFLVIPGVVNAHAHGLTVGPLFSSAAAPLTREAASANADRHLAAGVTTAVNICGFAIEEDRIEHSMRIELGTTNLPHAREAAAIVDGAGMTEAERDRTAEAMIASGAVAIGEVGSGATLGGGVAAYRYIPDAVRKATAIEIDPATATAFIDALVGPLRTSQPDDARLRAAMELHEVPESAFHVIRDAVLSFAAAPVQISLGSFAEACELSARTEVPAIFHTAEPSVRELLRLAGQSNARIIAGHMNHPSISPEDAVAAAMELRELGAVIDVSSLDIVHQHSMCTPEVADALVSAGVVDTLTTDYAGGNWEPMLALVQRWVSMGSITVEQGISMCSSKPAEVFGFADRGRIAPGLLADLVFVNPADLEDVRTVIVGGETVIG
jgi:imidazolonepropionase-like amidohydrolase